MLYARATISGVRVQHRLHPPGTSTKNARPCHTTRNFWKFCNTFIPVPETFGSSVRLPYPYPESMNAAEHNLVGFLPRIRSCDLNGFQYYPPPSSPLPPRLPLLAPPLALLFPAALPKNKIFRSILHYQTVDIT